MSSSSSTPTWLSQATPNPNYDLVSQCSVSCSGFSSLRPECEADACLANNLCDLILSADERSQYSSCADWCCVPHNGASLFMVLCIAVSVFCTLLGLYYANLFKKDERYAKQQAMSDAVDAATSGPSTVLQNARKRLSEFTSSS